MLGQFLGSVFAAPKAGALLSRTKLRELPRKGISHAELQSHFHNGMSLLLGESIGIGTPALLCAVCSIRVSGI
jgi:hypothetical protein